MCINVCAGCDCLYITSIFLHFSQNIFKYPYSHPFPLFSQTLDDFPKYPISFKTPGDFSILPFYWISNFQLHFYPACNFPKSYVFFSIFNFVYLQNSSSYFPRAYLDYCGGNCLPTCLLLILNPFADCFFPRDISFLQKWCFSSWLTTSPR